MSGFIDELQKLGFIDLADDLVVKRQTKRIEGHKIPRVKNSKKFEKTLRRLY